MSCSTCDDYQLVPGPDGILDDCPDCHAVSTVVCPVHRIQLVGAHCPICMREAARASRILLARARCRARQARNDRDLVGRFA